MRKTQKGFGRKGLSALATSTLVFGACALGAGAAHADAGFHFNRVGGQTRYDVSANVAGMYGSASRVILASGEDGKFGDALAANYLAGVDKAPILLTQLNQTPDAVKAAIAKTGAKNITIVGGPLSVSPAQEQSLKDDGYTVDRIQGTTRYDVDAAVIAAGNTTGNTAIIATGEKFADALAAGPLAYAKNLPVGLVQRDNAPSSVLDALKKQGVSQAIVLGGDLSISQSTRQQIENAGIKIVSSLDGANRAAVATMLADYEVANFNFTNTRANVATGREFAQGSDALSAGPLTGKANRPLLVTAGDPKVGTTQAIGQALLDWLQKHATTLTGTDNQLFGGPLSISDDMKAAMEKAAQSSSSSNETYAVSGGGSKTASAATDDPTTTVDESTQGTFNYSVSILGTTPVYIALVKPSDVKTDAHGKVTFLSSAKAGQADLTPATSGAITSVNGVQNSGGGTMTSSAVTPNNGTVTFSVNSSSPGSAVPVVFSAADNNKVLELDSTTTGPDVYGAPTEAFGVGNAATWTSPNAATAPYVGEKVSSVDTTAKTFQADSGAPSGSYTFSYAAPGDTFTYTDGTQLTQAQFESYLSAGDVLNINYNASGPSTFTFTTDKPAAPTGVTAAPAKSASTATYNDAIKVNWTKSPNPDVTGYTVQRAEVDSTGKAGTFTAITGGTGQDANPTTTSYTDKTVTAGKTYEYRVVANASSTSSDPSEPSSPVKAEAAAIPGAVAGPPTIAAANLTTDSGIPGYVDAGDVWTLAFNEPIQADSNGNVTGAMTVKDGSGNIAAVSCGTTAGLTTTCTVNKADVTVGGTTYKAGTVVTVTVGLVDFLQSASAVAYPVTINTISGFHDVDEDSAPNLANSADKTIG